MEDKHMENKLAEQEKRNLTDICTHVYIVTLYQFDFGG